MEKYIAPEMEVVTFDSEDVITTSCPTVLDFGGNDNGYGVGD